MYLYREFFKGARLLWTLIVGAVGFAFLIIGLAGLFFPIIPGLIFIFLGLLILATEFVWAKIMLVKFKKKFKKLGDGLRKRK